MFSVKTKNVVTALGYHGRGLVWAEERGAVNLLTY